MSKDYEDFGILGKGGFGFVRKVKSMKDGQFYAQKRVINSDDALHELKNTENADHVNIVKLFYYERKRKYIYFYLEIAELGDLKTFFQNDIYSRIMKGSGPTVLFLKQISSGLKYLHEKDVMHRDLKPGNVLCFKTSGRFFPTFKLADLGLSKEIKQNSFGQRVTYTYCGTDEYMAPEVLLCNYSFSADIWSFGALVSYWCNGKHLFKDVNGVVNWISDTCPLPEGYRQDIKDKVTAMLDKKPERRPTASDLNNFIFDVEKFIFSKFRISLLECFENFLSENVLFINNLNNNCSKSKGGELCDNNEKMVVDVNQPPYKSEENRSINNEGLSLSIHASRSVPWDFDMEEEEVSLHASNNLM